MAMVRKVAKRKPWRGDIAMGAHLISSGNAHSPIVSREVSS